MRFRTVAAFAAGVIVAAAGTAYATTKASIVGSDNQIHGCYLENAGLLRVVSEGTTCRDSETAISWDAHGGPTGPQGPAGPTGPAGPKGDPGSKWRGAWSSTASYNDGDIVRYADGTWIKGNPNFACFVGSCPSGPPNANRQWVRFTQDGATGPAGVAGPQGSAGPTGPPGPTGPQGPVGPKGDPGAGGVSGYKAILKNVDASNSVWSIDCPTGMFPVSGGFSIIEGTISSSNAALAYGPAYPRRWVFSIDWNAIHPNAFAQLSVLCVPSSP